MADVSVIHGFGGTLTITASGGQKRFSMRAYSGGKLFLKEFPWPVVVDLEGMQVESQQLPCPWDHDDTKRVGQTDSVTITPRGPNVGVMATGFLDTDSPRGKLIAAAKSGGFEWEASIGAPLLEALEEVPAGKPVTINGLPFVGPILVARRTLLREISFVDRGADLGQTHIAIAARRGIPMK